MVTMALEVSTEMKVASGSANFSPLFSVGPLTSTPSLFLLTKLVTNIKIAHHVVAFTTRALYARNTTCSFVVSPICSLSSVGSTPPLSSQDS